MLSEYKRVGHRQFDGSIPTPIIARLREASYLFGNQLKRLKSTVPHVKALKKELRDRGRTVQRVRDRRVITEALMEA